MLETSNSNKKCKIRSKVVTWGLVTHFWIFGTPLISRGRIKLENFNLAPIFMAVSTNEKNAKLGQKGSYGVHFTYVWNFVTP